MLINEAKELRIGQTVYHTSKKNADVTAMRAKVTSIKTWKTRPFNVEVHVKRGLYEFAVFYEDELLELTTTEPIYPKEIKR
jgi:hypothetical protein